MANALQTLVDSKFGIVFSTAAHTLGAIGLLGGLVAYVVWHRHLHRGHSHPQLLGTATFLTYFSILVNLVGGFMRTYETGHPHLTEFATSSWVRAITIKHVFLFAGMAAAVYLLEVVAPRTRRAFKEGTLAKQSLTGHRIGVLLLTLGIVVAAILGALSSILLAAATPAMDDEPVPVEAYHNATGQLLGTPLAPANAGGTFVVPANRTDIGITLTWTPSQANLQLELVDPAGRSRYVRTGAGGSLEDALGEAPRAGVWSFQLTSPDAIVNAQWTLSLHLPVTADHGH